MACGQTEASLASRYSSRAWHLEDGLPSEDITNVYQDRAGYLWLTTARGLLRFDGVYFESFAARLQAAGFANINSIVETAELGMVMAPSSGGTIAYKDGAFRALDFAAGKSVNALFAEPDGTLWASCDDQTLLRRHQGKTEILRPNDGSKYRLVARFAADPAGRLWIAGGTMIGRYEAGRLELLSAQFEGVDFRVASSRTNGPWILTSDRLLKQEADGTLRVVLAQVPPLVGAHYVSVMLEDRSGTLWLGTRSQGLYAVIDGECRLIPTSSEAITGLCEDSEGDIWVASNGGGLNRFRLRDFRLFDRSAGLKDNFSYTVSEDAQGTIWFGNRDGGVARLRDGRIEALNYSLPGWPRFSVMSVVPGKDGKIWITNGAGGFQIDPARQDELTQMEALPGLVRVSFVAENGDYWAALEPDRIGRYREGKFEAFGASEGYEGKQVRCIAEDPRGDILVGTADGKLFRFDGRRFARVPLNGVKEAGIQAIHCEASGLILLGTSASGLYLLEDGGCRQLTTADGIPDNSITTIIADDQGYLWFGSTTGIFSLRRQELDDWRNGTLARVHSLIVGRDDGLRGLTCVGIYKPSAWKSRDGRLWFATRKGVLNFDPARAITDDASPPAIVASIRCDDLPRESEGDNLEIDASVRKLELRLSVLCLSTPDRVQIKYRLDGFDSAWVTAGADRTATYPRLPPGRYRLHTRSSLGNGAWNETDSALAIEVRPLWWQTLWFQIAVALALVGAVALVVRTVSHRRLRLRLERLEHESAIERERTRIARNIHDDLGASLTRISLLTQSAKRADGTPENPQLAQIHETVRQITRSMDEIVWAVDPKNDHLDGLASYLVSYAQSFLSVAGLRCRLDLPDQLPAAGLTSQTRHNLYLCLKEALNNIVKHSGATEVTIAMRVGPNTFTLIVSDNGRCGKTSHVNGYGAGPVNPNELRIASGQGLANIAQRVAEMGGTWRFTPPGAGMGASLSIDLAITPPPAGLEPAEPGRPVKSLTP